MSVNANLDRNKIQLKDGKLTGLDEQLTQLKTDKPFLFKSAKPTNTNTAIINLGGPTPGAAMTDADTTASMRAAMDLPAKK